MALVPHYREPRDYGGLAVTRDDDRWILFFFGTLRESACPAIPVVPMYRILSEIGGRLWLRESLLVAVRHVSKELGGANYDYVKTVITIAKKNGWDLESLDLIPKDLHIAGEVMSLEETGN